MIGRTWALGDIHGNARALRAALALVDDKGGGDLVVMGDLLTYGPDVDEVVDLVADRVDAGAALILGNHDELYLDLLRGERGYYDGLPQWIRETVDWTLEALDDSAFTALPFVERVERGEVLFAHGNPFGDWAYLNSDDDHARAGQVLREQGFRVGVFGHTHRSRVVELPTGRGLGDDGRRELVWRPEGDRCLVLNTGSVGQPRNRTATTSLLELTGEGDALRVRVHELAWDRQGHVDAVRRMSLSATTTDRLCRFFEAS